MTETKEMGLFDERGGAGVPDEDVNEVGQVARWHISQQRRHEPHDTLAKEIHAKGHVAVGGEEIEGDEGKAGMIEGR